MSDVQLMSALGTSDCRSAFRETRRGKKIAQYVRNNQPRNKKQESRGKRQEARGKRQEARDERQEAIDNRQ